MSPEQLVCQAGFYALNVPNNTKIIDGFSMGLGEDTGWERYRGHMKAAGIRVF